MWIAVLMIQIAATPPDIEIKAHVRARSLIIEKKGETNLTLYADPPGEEVINIEAPTANGRSTLRNIEVNLQVQARLADPREIELERETPQPR